MDQKFCDKTTVIENKSRYIYDMRVFRATKSQGELMHYTNRRQSIDL